MSQFIMFLRKEIGQTKKTIFTFAMVALSFLMLSTQVHAQRAGLSLVRDAQIEALVRDYARPLMKAAGLRPGSIQFHLVNDDSFNAFVSGRGLFINTGLLLQSETPNEVIGVLAHELGHIIGGHQVRLRERLDHAKRIARWTTLLGLGIGAAGAATGSGDVGKAGFGLALSGQSFALRDLLRYQRSEEASADRSAATLLRKSKQSGAGFIKTLDRLSQNLALAGRRINPYLQSHPHPRERMLAMRPVLLKSPYYKKKASSNLALRHDMVRAKIAAYTGGRSYARALLNGKRLQPTAKLYGRAIVAYLFGSPRKALPLINQLIKRMPSNAYVHEMKGEILFRSGKAAAAARHFRKAVKYDKTRSGFLRIELGHALLESGGKKNAQAAIVQLNKGLARDRTSAAGYQFLARAYAQLGQTANALLASAEMSIRTGKKGRAKSFAKRAQQSFKRGSPRWLRAEDIILYK